MGEPVLVGLLFADRVITEKNNKKGVIGTFNRFHADKFPVTFPPWFVYAAVTNLEGDHTFALNLVSDETQQIAFAVSGTFHVNDTLDVVELDPVVIAVFPQPGLYNLIFIIDGQQAGARVLRVDQAPPPGK